MKCVATRYGQATPGQVGDEMARHHLPGQDACHQFLEEWGGTPTMRSPLFFMFMMDFCTITSGILPNSTPNFPLQSSNVSRERLVHFLFHIPQRKNWVALRWVGGQGVPPQPLDGMHPVLVSSHFITILACVAWPNLAATQYIWAWLALGSAPWQGKPCPPTDACS